MYEMYHIVKVNLPPVYAMSNILESIDQCAKSPGVYLYKYYDRNLNCGYSKNMYTRARQHTEFTEYRYKDFENKIPFTNILQLEMQSKHLANGFEMFVHHYFPSLFSHSGKENRNFIRQLNLEKEYNDRGGKELEFYQLLGYPSLPCLEDLIREHNVDLMEEI